MFESFTDRARGAMGLARRAAERSELLKRLRDKSDKDD